MSDLQEMRKSASVAIDEWGSNSGESGQEYSDKPSFPTIERHNIFHTCLQSSLPPAEKSPERLGQEGFVAIAAGGETCGRMLTNALFHILTNKDRVMPGLKKELFEIMPTPEIRPDWQDLERLPYLVRIPPSPPASCVFFLLPLRQSWKRSYQKCFH